MRSPVHKVARASLAAATIGTSAVGAMLLSPSPAGAALETRTLDSCSFVGFNNAHYHPGSTAFDLWTSVQWQAGNYYDPDCTGYVEARCLVMGTSATQTSSSSYVSKSCQDSSFVRTDHNARSAVTGVLWGFPLYRTP